MANQTEQATVTDCSIPGLWIGVYESANPWALVVKSAAERKDWAVYSSRVEDRVSPTKTPTAILYKGKHYRIHEACQKDGQWVYSMKPWPEGTTCLHIVELDRMKLEEEQKAKRDYRRMDLEHRISPIYDYLLGWLPSRVQWKLSERWGFEPDSASMKNAILCCLLAVPLGLAVIPSRSFGLFALWVYFFLESVGRFAHAYTSEGPAGMLLAEVADRAYMRWRAK